MTAVRIAVRAAITAAVSAGVAALGGRVYPHRSIPLQLNQLPAAAVYGTGETITNLSDSPIAHKRTARFVVHLIARGDDELEEALDTLAASVESAVYASAALDALEVDWSLVGIEGPELQADGETITGEIRVVWEVLYASEPQQGAAATDDFELAHIEIETHSPRTGPEAEADIDLEVAP